ncbi:MAG: hypothetical protein HC866_26305 [Leptolyngbyaceae cyanobacterium RU_5_1]|nr:hypothetical protein [Leptolyngbyaceae cyanobacterium RU_5_1]
MSTSLALGTTSFGMQSAIGAESGVKSQNQPPSPQSIASPPTVGLPDGVYLYGQSPKPNELGKGYFVFESKQGKVIGALYVPHSSFDCATGTFSEKQLALTVTNTYDRTTNPFEIALERTATVARMEIQQFARLVWKASTKSTPLAKTISEF